MQALVKTQKGVGHLSLMDMPEPRPGAGETLIEVRAAGICGTDVHVKNDTFPYWPPVILGHEFAGVVVELGPDCMHFAPGDRVVGEPHTRHCGQCYLCRTGNVQICAEKRSPGWGIHGSMAKYLVMPERLLHRIPNGMDFDTAAVVEPTANAVHDVLERAGVKAGDFVVVLGPGPIGLLAAMTARAAGARRVAVVGTPADEGLRLQRARQLGFDPVLTVNQDDVLVAVLESTGGAGADLVVECSGAPAAIAGTVDLVRKRGRICAIGLTGGRKVEFPWEKAAFKVADLHFCLSTSYTSWDRAIHLIATNQIPAERIITHRLPLADWEKAFEEIESLRALKVILYP
ncbi:MAG TPA: alcohol dehydrogenase catalytic domain-containing protein [Thermoguttaceae bacterium]|nr:alcohol dehydrogenase catalytic domain-containing protein [Thermoguttaceae bacterium]